MFQGFAIADGQAGNCYEGIPVSAFSKGDLLTLTSSSSLSRIGELFPSGAKIVGIALADSNQSVLNKVPYQAVTDETLCWASADTAISALTVGSRLDIAYGVGNGRCYVTNASSNSIRAIVVKGSLEIDQSDNSKVLVRLLTSGAETAFI